MRTRSTRFHSLSVVIGAALACALLGLTSFRPAGSIDVQELATLLDHLRIVEVDDGQGGKAKTIRFVGVNVQIVNGLGATNGDPSAPYSIDPATTAVNGLGNLIVGYNELHPISGSNRTGSHNLVVGSGNDYTSFGGQVVGHYCNIEGAFASVGGGASNTASGKYATVSGGRANRATGESSVVSGGRANSAEGPSGAVSGGWGSRALGEASWVGGGEINTASGDFASVAGGFANHAKGDLACIGGGRSNDANGQYSAVCGGSENVAAGIDATVTGGCDAFLTGDCAQGP